MRPAMLPGAAVLAAAALAVSGCEMNGDDTAEAPDDAPVEEEAPDDQPEDEGDPDEDADDPAQPPAEPGEEAIDIEDFEFVDGDLTVPVGTTVEWTQQDDVAHTVDFEDGEASGQLEEGETYSRTFDEPGEYDYSCSPHPQMTGTITVEE